jgi:type IV secretion system protein VirB8
MDKRAKEIANGIETGEYFSEARQWYNKVFVYPLKQSAMMRVIGYVTIVMSVIMGINLYQVFPLVSKVNIIARLNDTVGFIPKLVLASDPKKTNKQFVIEELSSKYVMSRESYNPGNFKTNYIFLLKSSSKEIFDVYYKYITSKDPDNPLNLYLKKHVTRVKVLNKQSWADANKVTIIFNKEIFDIFGAFQYSSKWKADIEFYLSKYDFNDSTDAKLDFIVTKYIVSEIKNSEKASPKK